MFGMKWKKSIPMAAALLGVAFAPAAWAACPSTSTIYDVSGSSAPTNTYYIAVAANFTTTLYNWLGSYYFNSSRNPNYNATNYATYKFELCSDSTGNLKTAINAGTLTPILFFGADNTPVSTTGVSGSLQYAVGYPVLIGYTGGVNGAGTTVTKTVSSVSDLINGLTGGSQDIPTGTNTLANYYLSTTLTSRTDSAGVLIADPALAPYGYQAMRAINTMEGLSLSNNPDSTTIPAWLKPLATYSSVNKAYNKIGVDTYAGFAAYSLICNNLPSNAYWVRITGSSYLTSQYVGRLAANDPTATHPGQDALDLITAEMDDSNNTWLNLMTNNGCYAGFE